MFGMGSVEVAAPVELEAGAPVEVTVEFSTRAGRPEGGGLRIGWEAPEPPDLLDRAVTAAAAADAVVLVVGTSGEWESEGHDRTMDLPGRQDELVRRAGRQPRHGGGGQRGRAGHHGVGARGPGRAADLVRGPGDGSCPGRRAAGRGRARGRLPTTRAVWLEHNPSYGNFPGEAGHVRYGEGVLVGYRWYEARSLPVRYPFGHGGSYTTWSWGTADAGGRQFRPGDPLAVRVPVANTGARRGAQVVQCYVAPPATGVVRPPQELAAFAKVWLDPGETATVELVLDERAFAYWAPASPTRTSWPARASHVPMTRVGDAARTPGWRVEQGRYQLRVGTSSADIAHVVPVDVVEG